LSIAYPAAVRAIVNQLGFHIGWASLVTIVGGIMIWRSSNAAILVTAQVGGLSDLAHFLFIDLGDVAESLTGGLMAYVYVFAIILHFTYISRETSHAVALRGH
jgi:hypothetical protein